MELRKKMRGFFTLTRKANGGFTLVELIVVIAILAILAGVAIPVYSGYIKKAETAGDEALLAELNMAFASACAINGESHIGRSDVSITLTGENGAKTVDEVTVTGIEGFAESFDNFYEGGAFAVITKLNYHKATGMFSPESAFTMDADKKTAFLASIFNEIGVGELTTKVDDLTSALSNTQYAQILMQEEKFLNFLVGTGEFGEILDENGNIDPAKVAAINADPALKKKLDDKISNASVLFVSDVVTGNSITGSSLVGAIDGSSNDYPFDGLLTGLEDKELIFTDCALKYGIMTAYYNNKNYATSDALKDFNDASAVLADDEAVQALWEKFILEQNFSSYMNNQATKDADGFLAALNTINQNKDNLDWSNMDKDGFYNGMKGDIEDALK